MTDQTIRSMLAKRAAQDKRDKPRLDFLAQLEREERDRQRQARDEARRKSASTVNAMRMMRGVTS